MTTLVTTAPGKTNWHEIYAAPTPIPYFDVMTPTHYGSFQDRLVEFVPVEIDRVFGKDSSLKAVEFGALFGNTTLAYRCGMTWERTGEFWKNESETCKSVRNISVVGVDLADRALDYGKRRGVFDETFIQNFRNEITGPLADRLIAADLLVMVMISSYISTPDLLRICMQFLGDRTKTKMIVFNDTEVFDEGRNLTPVALFAGMQDMAYSLRFIKHRNFTEEESLSHHNCRESWCHLWVATFNPLL